jgi:SP family general alpha glucoside:H+ symporter-like MFS transporter
MRGFLTAWVSMCWGSGSFLAAGILRASLGLPGDWAWRVPYMLQWIWPVPLFLVAYFAPESPYFLVRQERYEEAEKVLVRLARKDHYTPLQLRQQIALMKHTNEMEKRDAKTGSYADCFRGVNKRRTEIACVAFLTQIWSGQAICSYATVFLRAAGMAQTMAFNYSMAIQSTNILTTGIAISLMGRVGRRTFYLCGLTAIGLSMMGIGIVGFVSRSSSASIAVAVLMILVNASFKTSIGPTCYPIVSEMPSGRTRAQSIVLARSTYVVGNIILNQLVPRQLSVDAWNWGAKCGLFWMAFDVCFIVYHYFRLPETSKRTFGELEYLFQKGVPARQFKNYHIDGE